MDKKFKRKKIVINKPLQFIFSGITIYFILIVIIVVGGLTYFITLNTILSQIEMENKFINAYEIVKKINILLLKKIGLLILLLIILVFYLEIRFLHRIAGPLFRIERTLKEISEGKDVEPIKLRKKDFYKSLAESVNKVIEYINKLKKN
jgi:methyl-accepting chemotaxis protein